MIGRRSRRNTGERVCSTSKGSRRAAAKRGGEEEEGRRRERGKEEEEEGRRDVGRGRRASEQ
eukprot:753311-Hanusia_phi.AAC.4